MSKIILIGANHKTAPVEIREKLSFSGDETLAALEYLKQDPQIKEGLVFSTCNRMEILYIPETGDQIENMIQFVADHKGIAVSEFRSSLYILEGDEAIRHMFCVAASLDSMMVGEPQILGQVKLAYKNAVKIGASGVLLNRMMHKSFSVAKRVRKETGIGDNAVSISYAAIELANKIFSDLSSKSVMLLGAGEMAELAVEHLMRNRARDLLVANRTFERGLALARQFNGRAIRIGPRA